MRGRPPLPSDVQEMSGAWDKNPQRRRVDAQTEAPIDINSPPPNMNPQELELWIEIIKNAPIRVLKNSDKFIVEAAARALAEMRYCDHLTAPQRNVARTTAKAMLSLMGMTPADRARVESGFDFGSSGDDDYANEFKVH